MYFLLFHIGSQECAIDLFSIDRVIQVVEFSPLPHAPFACLGAINLHGEVVPVINLRALLGIPDKEIDLSDQLLICKVEENTVALWIDRVKKIITSSKEELSKAPQSFYQQGIQREDHVIRDDGRLIPVLEVKALLQPVVASQKGPV